MSHAHEKVEKNIGLMAILIAVAISFGGLVEIIPLMYQAEAIKPLPGVKPYPPLELAGREVYIREGCYNCHSQMVRTLRFETERYGHYSLAGESVYDRPFQWGSKRTGPDLARVGGRYSDDWHRVHLIDPRAVVPASIMPAYPWLMERLDTSGLPGALATLARLGVPYDAAMIAHAEADATAQGQPDGAGAQGFLDRHGDRPAVRAFDGDPSRLTEMDAVVAYLQSLGTQTAAASAILAEDAP